MDIQPAETVEVRTVSNRAVGDDGSPSKSSGIGRHMEPHIHVEYKQVQLPERYESSKLRRPVRPVDRQRMRPWLMELLDMGNVYGLCWTNRHKGVFQISWRHASRLGWNLETDGDVFERWARHTGIYKEGDPPEPKRWKANFRCALHSLHDVEELTTPLDRRGMNACRTYRFLQSSELTDDRVIKKRANARKSKEMQRYERPKEEVVVQEMMEPEQAPVYELVTTEIVSNDVLGLPSESESEEEDKQERVIVQLRPELAEEELGLHHDHDYSVLPDKSQKTIVLRQGIGSVVLHKEVFDESGIQTVEHQDITSASNLDQLASAATSTVGWNTVLAPGISTSGSEHSKTIKQKIKTKLTAKELAAAGLMRVEDERAAYNLKYLLTGNKEDASVVGESSAQSFVLRPSKRRKTESMLDQPHPSISVGAEETVGTESSVSEEMGEMVPYVHSRVNKSPRRTASPRILSNAKARRQRSKSEKADSESTEPLMSSCLLLLEAATRLDNAEKDTTGVRTRGKRQSSARTTAMSISKTGKVSKEPADASDEDSESSSHAQSEDTMIITADQDLHMVLRKTLENLKNRTAKVIKQEDETAVVLEDAEESYMEDEAAHVTETVTVVTEVPPAKGLFSGSRIQVQSPAEGKGAIQQHQTIIVQGTLREDGVTYLEETGPGTASSETVGDNSLVEVIVQGGDNPVTYMEGDPVEDGNGVVIESVADGTDGQLTSSSDTTFVHDIPPGSVLLQTGDGTPIGILDADGKLTAFQSAEARSAISLLTSRIDSDSTEQSVEQIETVLQETGDAPASVATDESHVVTFQLGSGDGDHQVEVKVENISAEVVDDHRLIEEEGGDAAVKVEMVEPGYTLPSDQLLLSTDGSLNDSTTSIAETMIPYISHFLLHELKLPFTVEGILSNFKKAHESYKAKVCDSPLDAEINYELHSNSSVKRLEELCKIYFIGLGFSLEQNNSSQSESLKDSKVQIKMEKSKKIKTLPVQWSSMQLTSQRVPSGGQSVIDPTAPLSLGEIPLFASAKGDSDSMSPPKLDTTDIKLTSSLLKNNSK